MRIHIEIRSPLRVKEHQSGFPQIRQGLRRLRKLKKDEALESATAEIRAQAEALSTLIDGLPLALDQAAGR